MEVAVQHHTAAQGSRTLEYASHVCKMCKGPEDLQCAGKEADCTSGGRQGKRLAGQAAVSCSLFEGVRSISVVTSHSICHQLHAFPHFEGDSRAPAATFTLWDLVYQLLASEDALSFEHPALEHNHQSLDICMGTSHARLCGCTAFAQQFCMRLLCNPRDQASAHQASAADNSCKEPN